MPAERIARVGLEAPADAIDALAGFYGDRLGLRTDGAVAVDVGGAELRFAPAAGGARPFYHFALLVPGDRFEAAHDWAAAHAELLPGRDGDTVFRFDFWDALACYLHDPAGNIVELIAHRGEGDNGVKDAFAGEELLGISEIGIVSDAPAATIETLERDAGIPLWSGGAEGGLAFVGRKAHTLLVAAEGRGWMPTGRPAEPHPVDILLDGDHDATAQLPQGRVVIRA